MSSPAIAVPHHPLSRDTGTHPARPVVEITIVIHAGPDALDAIRKLTERLSPTASVTSTRLPAGVLPRPYPGEPCDRRLRTATAELVLRPHQRTAQLGGHPLVLTRREYDLLLFLARNGRRAFTRGQLLGHIWEADTRTGGRTIDVHVRRLRAKLAGRGPTISTVRGVGYRLDGADRLYIDEPSAPAPGHGWKR